MAQSAGEDGNCVYPTVVKLYNVVERHTRRKEMTVLEERFMETTPHILREIASQLKLMNKLKVLELKERLMDKSEKLRNTLADIEKDVYSS